MGKIGPRNGFADRTAHPPAPFPNKIIFMNKQEMKYVLNTIESEGFDYCFRDYSDFDDIEDPEFHKLREAYKDAANKLEDYVRSKGSKRKD